jgi:hypothetical protein
MDMKTYLKQAAPDEREALAVIVKSSVGYFYLIGGGHRNPSNRLCKKLVAAEPKLTLCELRPDIWADGHEVPALSATDPEREPDPAQGHAGRQPLTTNGIFGTVPPHAAVGLGVGAKP